jgi:hypothetical protein
LHDDVEPLRNDFAKSDTTNTTKGDDDVVVTRTTDGAAGSGSRSGDDEGLDKRVVATDNTDSVVKINAKVKNSTSSGEVVGTVPAIQLLSNMITDHPMGTMTVCIGVSIVPTLASMDNFFQN